MGELSKLPNIGKTVEKRLIQAGIGTPEALREMLTLFHEERFIYSISKWTGSSG